MAITRSSEIQVRWLFLCGRGHNKRDIVELLTRPVGRPSQKPVVRYKGLLYQTASWKTARRVVVKVEFQLGEMTESRAVVRFYNKRGTAEQWIKEGKQAVKMTRLSCHYWSIA